MKLVASMIVKNELQRYLPMCIGHLREFCDLIAVIDDGSTDRTGEWLDDNTDDKMVVKHIDEDDGFFAGHEGRRRQALLEFTIEQKPTHVLAIDADEFITDGLMLRNFCDGPRQVGTLQMEEVWKVEPRGLQIRMDGGWRPHPCPILWKAPPVLSRRWRIQNRALACGREPEIIRGMGGKTRPTDVQILHFGWAKESERIARHARYVEADDGKYHQNAHLQSILWPDMDVTLEKRRWPPPLLPWRDLIIEGAT